MASSDFESGLKRARARETNTHKPGIGMPNYKLPGVVGKVKVNPTKSGGINRATQPGMTKGSSRY